MTEETGKVKTYLYLVLRIIVLLLIIYYIILPIIVPVFSYHTVADFINSYSNHEDLYLTTKDDYKINVWYKPAQKDNLTVVFCHGNGTNLSYGEYLMNYYSDYGYGFVLFDYRGYGKSTGRPGEKGLYTDLNTVLKYLEEKQHIPGDKIVLWGHSLGANIAIEAASKNDFKGVILQGATTSCKDGAIASCKNKQNPVFEKICYLLASNFIFYENYDNKPKIRKIKSPVLIAHSKGDKAVPYEMAETLAKLNPDAELFISEEGTHNNVGWLLERVLKFLKSL